MGKIFFDITVSLDAFSAGENRGPQNPIGDNGEALHNWMLNKKAFWKSMNIDRGDEEGEENDLIANVFARTGAYIMGKRMFDEGEVHWPENLFKAPVYVVTHEKREPWVQKGSTTFYFINDGIEVALAKARETCNGKDIRIQGGANIIQQFINAGHIEEFTIHFAPMLLGSGITLFDHVDKNKFKVQPVEIMNGKEAVHITYKVV